MDIKQEKRFLITCQRAFADSRDTIYLAEIERMAALSDHAEIRDAAKDFLADPNGLGKAQIPSPVGSTKTIFPTER